MQNPRRFRKSKKRTKERKKKEGKKGSEREREEEQSRPRSIAWFNAAGNQKTMSATMMMTTTKKRKEKERKRKKREKKKSFSSSLLNYYYAGPNERSPLSDCVVVIDPLKSLCVRVYAYTHIRTLWRAYSICRRSWFCNALRANTAIRERRRKLSLSPFLS